MAVSAVGVVVTVAIGEGGVGVGGVTSEGVQATRRATGNRARDLMAVILVSRLPERTRGCGGRGRGPPRSPMARGQSPPCSGGGPVVVQEPKPGPAIAARPSLRPAPWRHRARPRDRERQPV